MNSRDEILKRVDEALEDVPRAEAPSYVPRVDVLSDSRRRALLPQLEENLERLDAVSRGPLTAQGCLQEILKIAREHEARSALLSEHPLLDELGLAEQFANAGISRVQAEHLGELDEAVLGIGVSEWAVCSTGTLVLSSRREKIRTASLLPPVSVILQPMGGLVADLNSLFSLESFQNTPGARIFVTGPSRTGDIELSLTKGVHGPGKVYVLLLKQE